MRLGKDLFKCQDSNSGSLTQEPHTVPVLLTTLMPSNWDGAADILLHTFLPFLQKKKKDPPLKQKVYYV